MPDALTILGGFAILAVGCLLGWLVRASRGRAEKAAINDGWREQIDAQATERKRIEHQNRSLMRQVSELQLRVNEQGKDRREDAHSQKPDDKEQRGSDPEHGAAPAEPPVRDDTDRNELSQRRIARLENEVRKWQERVPPVIERFRQRDSDAKRLERELEEARSLIARYQQQPSFDETRAGAYPPGDPDAGSDASNDMLAALPRLSLRDIRGIGPATNRRLANLGIRELADLINASDEDLERIEETVKGAQGKTADWQKQAAQLLDSNEDR